jgi:DnaJ-class molecular chaperone
MSRRRSSGFLETLVKSVFGFGTTVHHSRDWVGRPKKTVIHHDSGKQKTTTYGCGFLGNITRREKKQHNHVYEKSETRARFFGGRETTAHRSNGTTVHTESGKGFWGNHGSRHVQGSCWSCGGSGVFERSGKTCRKCGGSGRYSKYRAW